MLQRSTCYITIITLLLGTIGGQLTEICPFGPSSSIRDPRWQPVPQRFEIITELSSGNVLTELSQAFSSTRDSVSFNYKGSKFIRSISFFICANQISLIRTSSILLGLPNQRTNYHHLFNCSWSSDSCLCCSKHQHRFSEFNYTRHGTFS